MPTTDVDGSTESNGMKNDEDGTTTESVTMSLLEKKKNYIQKVINTSLLKWYLNIFEVFFFKYLVLRGMDHI